MSDYGHKLTNDELKKLERRIEEVYKQAAEEEKKFIEEYFEKFKLRDAEMKLELDKGNITEQQYIDWRKTQIMRGDGFEAMQKKLSERMTKANEVAISYVNDATPSIYSLNRNYAAYTIEQATDAVDFTLFDERTVKRLIADNPSVMPYYPPKRAVNRGIDLEYGQKKISQIVTSGILRGVSIPTMANELQGQLTSMSRASAIRAARTATTGAQNGGRQDSYDAASKMGIKLKKEWMATLDDRTRVSHQELDGERVAPDKKFSNGLMFPGDPSGAPAEVYNCRCTMIAVFPETEKELNKRQTYKEWIAQKEVEEVEEIIIKTEGDLPYVNDRYTRWGGTGDWEWSEEAGRLKYVDNPEYQDRQRRYDTTIAQLQELYPLDKEMYVGQYDNVLPLLTDRQRERAMSHELVAGQQWDVELPDGRSYLVIGVNEKTLSNTLVDDVRIRKEKIRSGETLLTVFDNSPEGNAIHEYGHAFADALTTGMIYDDKNSLDYYEWYKTLTKEEIKAGISSYAATNKYEFEAECFAELLMPNPRPLAKKFEQYLVNSSYANYNEMDTVQKATEHLALKKDVLGCKVIQLPAKEYGHVMHELETWMTTEEREQFIVSKKIGNYDYTFVNDGNGYKCIKKIEINKEWEEYDD